MALVVTLTETMRGTHHFVDPALGDGSDLEFYFQIRWGGVMATVLNPLAPGFLRYDAEGVIFAQGLHDSELPCRGELELDYLHQHKITYRLNFEHQGKLLRYFGDKTDVNLLRPIMLIKTHTTCYGRIVDEQDRILSRSVLHFEPESIARFLASVRVSRA